MVFTVALLFEAWGSRRWTGAVEDFQEVVEGEGMGCNHSLSNDRELAVERLLGVLLWLEPGAWWGPDENVAAAVCIQWDYHWVFFSQFHWLSIGWTKICRLVTY